MRRNRQDLSPRVKIRGLGAVRARVETCRGLIAGLAIIVAVLRAASPSHGQEILPPDFLKPRLVVNGTGHTGPLKSLFYTPDGKYLLSAGLDKVVHVWAVDEKWLRLDRTIRPLIRHVSGVIYAMALSPVADDKGQRLLAVAGINPLGSGGRILLYRFPGLHDGGTGDLDFDLPPNDGSKKPIAQQGGHKGAVFGLSFSPQDGRYLASCGEDKTIRIWDLNDKAHPSVKVLEGHQGAVQRVAFLDRERLVSAGGKGDGAVILWDWNRPDPLVAKRPPSEQDMNQRPKGLGVQVNALAVGADARYVVVGRENGKLHRYDAADLSNEESLNREDWGKSLAIESLACSPDGQSLAVSNLKYSPNDFRNQFPRTECEIRIRNMPDGRVNTTVRTTQDTAHALTFSPNGRFLAIGGGEFQEIAIKDLQPPAQEANEPQKPDLAEFRGPGTVLWHVAFVNDKPFVNEKLVLAYARTRALGQDEPDWEAFDLPKRRRHSPKIDQGEQLNEAIKTFPGWTVDTSSIDQFRVVPDAGNPVVIALDLEQDRRWSSYTFIPPSADKEAHHPDLAVAVGLAGGTILIHNLSEGKRTRVLLGHSGPVYGLAPSADGRWLASVSSDQTARLWRLKDCDRRPMFGASFQGRVRGRGPWVVTEIEQSSFAEQMGLAKGDVVREISFRNSGRKVEDISDFSTEIAKMDLGRETISMLSQRPAAAQGDQAAPALQTTLRDLPALSFLPGQDREWIIWTPEGYYDTSIAGDRRLLGWHVNKLETINQLRVPRPSDFFPISRYKEQLYRPLFIDNLLATGQLNAAVPVIKVPPKIGIEIVAPAPAPAIGPAAPGAVVAVTEPVLNVQIRVEGGDTDRQIRAVSIYNGTRHDPPRQFNPPLAKVELKQEVSLQPDKNSITVEAVDNLGVKHTQSLNVNLDLAQPPPANLEPRLFIRSIGVETFAKGIPGIKHARQDAQDLATFLGAPGGQRRFGPNQIKPFVLSDHDASSQKIAEMFDSLAKELGNSPLQTGDTLFLVINSHVLNLGKHGSFLLGNDADARQLNSVSVQCDSISESLQEVAARGCWVVVLLDGIHDELSKQARRELYTWVRDLVDERGVMVLLASKADASVPLAAHGAFAQAVLESITVEGRTGNFSGDVNSPTLHDWTEAIIRRVHTLTGRRQDAGFYPPEFLDTSTIASMQIFKPQSRIVNLAKK